MPLFRDEPVGDERRYKDWIGRKTTTLRRRTLDCGCVNEGEVFYHLDCDRLACQKHAESPHYCGLFGGVKDKGSIEEEAVEPEAVAQSGRPLVTDCGCPNIGVSATCVTCGWWSCRDHMWDAHDCRAVEPEAVVAEPGPPVAWVQVDTPEWVSFVDPAEPGHIATDTARPAGFQRFERIASEGPVRRIPGPDRVHATQVTVMTEAEAESYRRMQTLSLECSRHRPMCSGCDGLAMDNFPCTHDCHEPAVCSCPEVDISAFGDRMRPVIMRGRDPGCRVHPAPGAPPVDEHFRGHLAAFIDENDETLRRLVDAPHVDAALQPDLDGPASTSAGASPEGAVTFDLRPAGLKSETGSRLANVSQRPDSGYAARPWWRRILPGGTR
jgi:hypothetical protein